VLSLPPLWHGVERRSPRAAPTADGQSSCEHRRATRGHRSSSGTSAACRPPSGRCTSRRQVRGSEPATGQRGAYEGSPALTPDCCWFPGLRRAHRVLRWSRADSREPSCHCVPLEVMPSQSGFLSGFSRGLRGALWHAVARGRWHAGTEFRSADHPALFWKVRACHPRAIPNDY
jgi:hypothetical protein